MDEKEKQNPILRIEKLFPITIQDLIEQINTNLTWHGLEYVETTGEIPTDCAWYYTLQKKGE